MVKQIEDENRLQYKKQLADFMAMINPKPGPEIIEKLEEKYRKQRDGK
jgi:hypothetical protein